MFESADPATKVVNPTDSRFFWLAMYAQPCLWVALAVLAVVRFEFIWLTLVGEFFLPCIFPILSWSGVVWCGVVLGIGTVDGKWEMGNGQWEMGNGQWGMDGILTYGSHRARPYNHEYPRLLAVRQVQPRVESGGERALLGWFGEESGWGGCE